MAKFDWISNEPTRIGTAYVTIDSQLRLYLSTGARETLNLPRKTKVRLVVGYDKDHKRVLLAKPEVVRATVRPFTFDKRGYASAKSFVNRAGVDVSALPLRFVLIGKEYAEYPAGAYAFELDDELQ